MIKDINRKNRYQKQDGKRSNNKIIIKNNSNKKLAKD